MIILIEYILFSDSYYLGYYSCLYSIILISLFIYIIVYIIQCNNLQCPLLCIIVVRLLIDNNLLSKPCGQIMTQLEGLCPLNIISLSLGDDWLIAWEVLP